MNGFFLALAVGIVLHTAFSSLIFFFLLGVIVRVVLTIIKASWLSKFSKPVFSFIVVLFFVCIFVLFPSGSFVCNIFSSLCKINWFVGLIIVFPSGIMGWNVAQIITSSILSPNKSVERKRKSKEKK